MPLYKIGEDQNVKQIRQTDFRNERELQNLFENNLETLMGVRFIDSEVTTGDRQRGRIDTLGIDEDGSPTIIEYKKKSNENIINQGLFYLDWLVDHKGDFTLAAQKTLGSGVEVDWSQPRLILIAESFSKYDEYAVNRIGANIELWIYRRYSDGFLYLDPIFVSSKKAEPTREKSKDDTEEEVKIYTIDDHLEGKNKTVKELFSALQKRILSLNEDGDITENATKIYISYKYGKNFCEVRTQAQGLKIWLDIPFEDLDDPYSFGRDVSKVGHHGTGDVEVKLTKVEEVEKVMYLVEQAYQQMQ
jgi:predicted transport protein